MRAKRLSRSAVKPSRRVKWEPAVVIWGVGVGMLLGVSAEVYWHGNMLWMTGGGLAGGAAGAVCDTALFLYRRLRQRRGMLKPLPS